MEKVKLKNEKPMTHEDAMLWLKELEDDLARLKSERDNKKIK